MKILISGGGIAGLTLAYWLRQGGAEPIIVEKDHEYRSTGYAVNLIGQCLTILTEMKLDESLKQHRINVAVNNLMDMQGKLIRKDDISDLNSFGKMGVFLRRSDLHGIILNAIKDRVELRMGHRVKALSIHEDRVDLTFDDGRHDSCDLFIGADGVHSHTRKLVFGGNLEERLGVVYSAFIIENKYGLPQEAFNLSGPGRMAGFTGLSREQISTLFWYRKTLGSDVLPDFSLAHLTKEFQHFGWIVKDVIRDVEMKDASTVFCDYATQVRLPTWYKGRVALIGDAAYCLSPLSLRGAGMAIQGAHVLATLLSGTADYESAFKNYDGSLRPEIEHLQSLARKNVNMMLPESQFQVHLRNFIIRLIPATMMKQMMIKQFAAERRKDQS